MMDYFIFLFLFLTGKSIARIVPTESGPVESSDVTLDDGIVIETFLGVPFAKPPLRELRFKPPVPHDHWGDVPFKADKLRSACPQGSGQFALTHPGWNDTNEDCLHLNLFVRMDRRAAPYAVMVYFHGGGYITSANIQYPGHFLAREDVIVVIPNYRLGHLGFISTNDDVAWGNWGMMDQVKALQWVQLNIAAFGGDPTKVTIFGQSAGASSAGLHMFSPMSKDLFHQAITESGSDLAIWAANWPNQNPENYTLEVAGKLGCPIDDNFAMIECLRLVDAETLRNTNFRCKPGHICQGFAPVIDHQLGFLPKTPHEYRLAGDYKSVPIISGTCSEDGALYLIPFVPESLLGGFNRTEFNFYLRERLVRYFSPRLPGQLEEDVYQALNFLYSPWPHIHDEDANRRALVMMITDFAYAVTTNTQIKHQYQKNSNVWQYVMGFRSTNASLSVPEWMGVPHNGELPYVFGYPFLKLNNPVRDNMQMHFDFIDWNDEDILYAKFVTTLWANFAKFGDPTVDPVQKPLTDGKIKWTKTQSNHEYNYINFDRDVEIKQEYRQLHQAFWLQYIPYLAKVPLIPTEADMDTGETSFILESDTMEKITEKFYASLAAERN